MKAKKIKLGLLGILVLGLVGKSLAAVPLWDNFESYVYGSTLSGQGGWGADASVTVSSNVFGEVTKLGALPPNTAATNAVPVGADGQVWTEFQICDATRLVPSSLPLVNSSAVVMVGVTTNGYAVVYNTASNGWDFCTNNARGLAVTGLSSGVWATVSVYEDFANTNVAVFLNGQLLRLNLPFINTSASAYSGLRFNSGAASTGYVDNVYVSNSIPSSLTNLSSTTDLDGDGMPDAVEIMQYGGLAKVVPGDYSTFAAAVAAAPVGGRIVVSNGTYATSLALSNGVTLIGAVLAANATNLTFQGAMTVTTGMVEVASGQFTVTGQVSIAAGGLLTISNTAANFSGLMIGSGGLVQVVNGSVTANGVTMTGTFTLDSKCGTAITASLLNHTDDFEAYPMNLPLVLCGGAGWGASDGRSIVQGAVTNSGFKAAKVVANTALSNTVSGAEDLKKVWTDMYLNDSAVKYPGIPYPATNANRAVVFFVNTNNHVVVWNSNAWDECATDALGNQAPIAATGTWFRVSVFEDFTAQKVAFFLNGQLLRQQVPFVSRVERYQGISFSAGAGAAYLDDVKIWTNMPPSLTNYSQSVVDLNHDGLADAVQISQVGIIYNPRGTVFKIR
jgi:hypothetical protein